MLLTLATFSLALAVLILALHFKGKRWDEYVVGFFAVFLITWLVTLGLTHSLGIFPAIRIESWFGVP